MRSILFFTLSFLISLAGRAHAESPGTLQPKIQKLTGRYKLLQKKIVSAPGSAHPIRCFDTIQISLYCETLDQNCKVKTAVLIQGEPLDSGLLVAQLTDINQGPQWSILEGGMTPGVYGTQEYRTDLQGNVFSKRDVVRDILGSLRDLAEVRGELKEPNLTLSLHEYRASNDFNDSKAQCSYTRIP